MKFTISTEVSMDVRIWAFVYVNSDVQCNKGNTGEKGAVTVVDKRLQFIFFDETAKSDSMLFTILSEPQQESFLISKAVHRLP
jgi:hypothetical protein